MMIDGWQRENYEKSLSDIYKIQHTLTMQVNNAIDDFVVRSVQEYGNNENIIESLCSFSRMMHYALFVMDSLE